MNPPELPKRLIEVDLPIRRISAHARREKSIRHGHISTLHIWWARRPLAACRAVICAALWPDPADPLCPAQFRTAAAEIILKFARQAAGDKDLAERCSEESWNRWMGLTKFGHGFDLETEAGRLQLRAALLDFIADFANWDSSTVLAYLKASRALTQSAHEALGGAPGTRTLVIDPFAGGGSIPLEALRVGADAFASDINPVAVLINKVVLEYIPKYGKHLADEVRKWGQWIKQEAEKELAGFYPNGPNGATPIAYLWARTIYCQGPGCGTEVPLIRSLWLAKKPKNSVALRLVPNPEAKRVEFQIIIKKRDGWLNQDDPEEKIHDPKFDGTIKRGSATCPCCGYTMSLDSVRTQLKQRHGGTRDARLVAVRQDDPQTAERGYRAAFPREEEKARKAEELLEQFKRLNEDGVDFIPNESTTDYHSFVNRGPIYGMASWEDYFTPRQLLALGTLSRLVRRASANIMNQSEPAFGVAVKTCLALNVTKLADFCSSLCVLNSTGGRGVVHTFGRQAIPMVWDFMETNPFNGVGANWMAGIEALDGVVESELLNNLGSVEMVSATAHSLPDDSAHALVTDPPYYYSVQYADLSDFFYVWLKRILAETYPDYFKTPLTLKDDEIIVQSPGHQFAKNGKNKDFYERNMLRAMQEARRILRPDGVGVIVFAHSSTSGWEAMLDAMINAGWTITGSWPIDTERESRLIGLGKAVLASSIHIACRPRENSDGSVRTDDVGNWRDILAELPSRIHDWMPRLAEEGVVGADAIFACLGPALEIFSRFSRVEKASGEAVTLKEYLEQVWAAVAREALSMIFEGAEGSGLEEDARLTAMWLWTLSTGGDKSGGADHEDEPQYEEDGETTGKARSAGGFALEFDAARKIAQGLGVYLDQLKATVEIKGDVARLLPVSERAGYLFGQETTRSKQKQKKKQSQLNLFELQEKNPAESVLELPPVSNLGETVLDRVHQSMLLFAGGRSEALKRFLVEDGVGRDTRFWKLAQALSALYPTGSDEKRWVDGVLARKKGLGF